MKLDLRGMLCGDVSTIKIDYRLSPAYDSEDPTSKLYGVSFPSPMEIKGEIVNTAGYMRMHLELSQEYSAECARCLSEVRGVFTVPLDKTVATADVLAGLPEDKLDDYAVVEDGFLDIDEQLTELMEIEFPSRFLCSPDCRGLCSKCGKNLNEGPCGCTADPDPRLAPLRLLLEKMKREEENGGEGSSTVK